MTTATDSAVHPLIGFAHALSGALDKAATCEPMFLPAAAKAELLEELHRDEQRLAALRLRVMAVAADVAEDTASRDVADWLAHTTHDDPAAAHRDLKLAEDLDRTWRFLGAAVAAGAVNLAQARVIDRALTALPDDLDPATVVLAEERLVELAGQHGPRALERLGRKILEVVAPDVAEKEEGRRLEDEERRARETTRLDFKRLGDGSTRLMAKLPDAVADRLRTYLDAFTSPRQDSQSNRSAGGGLSADGALIPAARKRGLAFAALLEHLDPQRLPDHGGDATTVMITLRLDQLRTGLGAAGVITSDHGDISAGEARRLACTAHLVPVVLGTKGEILDMGRATRLFTPAQRKALRLRDQGCRAEGCTVPVAWTEAHHWDPWSRGGSTNLNDGVLLCNFHHHRAHDNAFHPRRLPNGDVRFSRRT